MSHISFRQKKGVLNFFSNVLQQSKGLRDTTIVPQIPHRGPESSYFDDKWKKEKGIEDLYDFVHIYVRSYALREIALDRPQVPKFSCVASLIKLKKLNGMRLFWIGKKQKMGEFREFRQAVPTGRSGGRHDKSRYDLRDGKTREAERFRQSINTTRGSIKPRQTYITKHQ